MPEEPTTTQSVQTSEVQVPDLKNKTLFDAITELRELRLNYEFTNEDFDPKAERYNTRDWTVVDQDKQPGETVPVRENLMLTVEKKK